MSRYRNNNETNYKKTLGCSAMTVAVLVFIVAIGYQAVASIQFDRKYEGHLKRAADANSLELAERELQTAYDYLVANELTTEAGRNAGFLDDSTNIIYTTPDNQISFHVANVKASLDDVQAVRAKGEQATALERSNVLMKLRESLLDDGESGHHVTHPSGLSVFPNNFELTLALLCPMIVMIIGGVWLKLSK